jgi:ACS family hexuronate transporter-like MFS transporter
MNLPQPETPAMKLSKMRWVMISFALVATVLNYVHRLSFNYLTAKGPLHDMIPDDSFGYIGTAFFVAYMISNGISGFIIDRLGTKIGYSLSMAFWTTAGLLHAVAMAPFHFGIFRFLLGLGEAGNWPAAIKLTGEWFPPHERSTASGIFNSGAALGAIIAPPLIAFLGVSFGWQATFIIIGVLGYLWLAAFWFTYYTPGRAADMPKLRNIPPLKLIRSKFVWTLTLSKVFIDPIWYFITFWIGRYLADVHGWDLAKIGWFAAIPFIVADLGNILGGYFTQFIIQRGVEIKKARKIAAAIFGLLMGVSLISGPFIITSPAVALGVLGIAGFGYAAYNANTMAFPADVVPSNAVASVWGVASVGSGLGGALFQALSGLTVKHVSAASDYTSAYNLVFTGYGFLAIIGVSIVLFMMGPLVRDKKLQSIAEEYNKTALK